jgi:DNA repair exonuclease SbcCD ATPase subunit
MIFEQLSSTVSDFTHILHVADIHIRLTKRHTEYREVFEKLYDEVRATPETTVVCILGDVCHSKADLSPECVQMVSDFLYTLAELRETVLIPGNHDATLSNKSRMDALTPIVDALSHSKIHYLTETKLYGLGNILFNHMCVFDDPEKYIRGVDIPNIYRNHYKHVVALFHGPVDSSVTDTGFAISNPSVQTPIFDWNDIVLLGDIHRRQNLQEERIEEHKPCIHYCGSIIQQNHGEPLHPHGCTIWDLNTHNYQYKEIPNDYGYFTVELNGSNILTDLSDIPKKTYLRLQCLDCMPTDVKTIEAIISSKTQVVECSRVRIFSERDKKAKEAQVCQNVKLSEISDVDYQSQLITDFIQKKLNISDQTKIDNILLINRRVNTEIKKDEFARNIKWKPIRFEWDNMFTYGEGNYIDFSTMEGIYGVFGPNTCGKSSIFSAISFCLFDKWERGFKAVVARNVAKTNFRCKFEFEISGVRYAIEKNGRGTKSGNVSVDVTFHRIVNDQVEDLTDIMRRKTNDIIRDYIGTFEDFVLTTLSIQNSTKNNISFIDMGNTERKDLLVQFMGLNVFDRLHENASVKLKELATLLKPHKERNYINELDIADKSLQKTEEDITLRQSEISRLSDILKKLNEEIVQETTKLIKLDSDVPTNLKELEVKRVALQEAIQSKENELNCDRIKLENYRVEMDKLSEEISEVIVEDLVNSHKTYNDYRKELEIKLREFELKKLSIDNKNDKLKKLGEYKYDPNCKFCIENVFVKDARATEKDLKSDMAQMEALKEVIKDLEKSVGDWNWVEEAYRNYTNLLNNHSKSKDKYASLNTKVLLAEKDLEKSTQSLKDIVKRIELYHKNEVSVKINLETQQTIMGLKQRVTQTESLVSYENRTLQKLVGDKEVAKERIKNLTETIQKMIETEEERELYELYTQAVGRNGIPYSVICDTIPEITKEINSILTQTTDFTVDIDYDEKNIIPYVVYDTKGRWPIEMTSGFERFVVSVAIRVAMNNISNLPRTNFLIIDEGFGALDSHNLPSMYTLFTYLKSHFDFLMVVSHLDSLKDMVDKQIEITQAGNFSKVMFE